MVTTPSGSEEDTVNLTVRNPKWNAHTNISNRALVRGGLGQQLECFGRNLCGKPVEHSPIFVRHPALFDNREHPVSWARSMCNMRYSLSFTMSSFHFCITSLLVLFLNTTM